MPPFFMRGYACSRNGVVRFGRAMTILSNVSLSSGHLRLTSPPMTCTMFCTLFRFALTTAYFVHSRPSSILTTRCGFACFAMTTANGATPPNMTSTVSFFLTCVAMSSRSVESRGE